MRSGRLRRELGGEPGGAGVSRGVAASNVGSAIATLAITGRAIGEWFCCTFAAVTNSLPPGSVPLQQSSLVDGLHFPRLQQSAASFVNLPPLKQSKGLSSRRTATKLTAR